MIYLPVSMIHQLHMDKGEYLYNYELVIDAYRKITEN